MRITPRSGWNARPPKRPPIRIAVPSPRLWLHHAATDAWHGPGGVKACQAFHMGSRGYNDIAYSFLADVDGAVFEGRGAGILGGHTKGDNDDSHAVCAMGDFTKTAPTPALIEALAQIAAHGCRQGWWSCQGYTGGHRQAPGAQTACPGDRLQAAIPKINARVAELLVPAPVPPVVEEDFVPLPINRVVNVPEPDPVRSGLQPLVLDDIEFAKVTSVQVCADGATGEQTPVTVQRYDHHGKLGLSFQGRPGGVRIVIGVAS